MNERKSLIAPEVKEQFKIDFSNYGKTTMTGALGPQGVIVYDQMKYSVDQLKNAFSKMVSFFTSKTDELENIQEENFEKLDELNEEYKEYQEEKEKLEEPITLQQLQESLREDNEPQQENVEPINLDEVYVNPDIPDQVKVVYTRPVTDETEKIQGVVHGGEYIVSAEQYQELIEKRPHVLQQLINLNNKYGYTQNEVKEKNIEEYNKTGSPIAIQQKAEIVPGYALGGFVKDKTEMDIQKLNEDVEKINRVQELDYKLLPEIIEAIDEDIEDQTFKGLYQEIKKIGISTFKLDSVRNDHLEQMRRSLSRIVYLQELDHYNKKKSPLFGLGAKIKRRLHEIYQAHPFVFTLSKKLGPVLKSILTNKYLISGALLGAFTALPMIPTALISMGLGTTIGYIRKKRRPYDKELNLKGSLPEQQLEALLGIHAKTSQIYDKLKIWMDAQNIEDPKHQLRVYQSIWDNIKYKIESSKRKKEQTLYDKVAEEFLGYTTKKEYIKQKQTKEEISKKAEQEGISYKEQKKLVQQELKESWKEQGKLPLKDIKLVVQQQERLQQDTSGIQNIINKLKDIIVLKPEFSYSMEQQNLELLQNTLKDVSSYKPEFQEFVSEAGFLDYPWIQKEIQLLLRNKKIPEDKKFNAIAKILDKYGINQDTINGLLEEFKSNNLKQMELNDNLKNLIEYVQEEMELQRQKTNNELLYEIVNNLNNIKQILQDNLNISKNIKDTSDEIIKANVNLLNNHPLVPFIESQNQILLNIYDLLYSKQVSDKSLLPESKQTQESIKPTGIVYKIENIVSKEQSEPIKDSLNSVLQINKTLENINQKLSPEEKTIPETISTILDVQSKKRIEYEEESKEKELEQLEEIQKKENLSQMFDQLNKSTEETQVKEKTFIGNITSGLSNILDHLKKQLPIGAGAVAGWAINSILDTFGIEGKAKIPQVIGTAVGAGVLQKLQSDGLVAGQKALFTKVLPASLKGIVTGAGTVLMNPIGQAIIGLQQVAGTAQIYAKNEKERLQSTFGATQFIETPYTQVTNILTKLQELPTDEKQQEKIVKEDPYLQYLVEKVPRGKDLYNLAITDKDKFNELYQNVMQQIREQETTRGFERLSDLEKLQLIVTPFQKAGVKTDIGSLSNMSKELSVDIKTIFTEQIKKTLVVNDFMQWFRRQNEAKILEQIENKEYEKIQEDIFNDIKSKYDKYWKNADAKTQMEQFYYPIINTVRYWQPEKYYEEELAKNKDVDKNLAQISYLQGIKNHLLDLLLTDKDFARLISQYKRSKGINEEILVSLWDLDNSVIDGVVNEQEKLEQLLIEHGVEDINRILYQLDQQGITNFDYVTNKLLADQNKLLDEFIGSSLEDKKKLLEENFSKTEQFKYVTKEYTNIVGHTVSNLTDVVKESWNVIKDKYIVPKMKDPTSDIYQTYNGAPELIDSQAADISKFQEENELPIDHSQIKDMLIAGQDELTTAKPITWDNVIDGLQNIGHTTLEFFKSSINKAEDYINKQMEIYKENQAKKKEQKQKEQENVINEAEKTNKNPWANIVEVFETQDKLLSKEQKEQEVIISGGQVQGIIDIIDLLNSSYTKDKLEQMSPAQLEGLLDTINNAKRQISANENKFENSQYLLKQLTDKQLEIESLKLNLETEINNQKMQIQPIGANLNNQKMQIQPLNTNVNSKDLDTFNNQLIQSKNQIPEEYIINKIEQYEVNKKVSEYENKTTEDKSVKELKSSNIKLSEINKQLDQIGNELVATLSNVNNVISANSTVINNISGQNNNQKSYKNDSWYERGLLRGSAEV